MMSRTPLADDSPRTNVNPESEFGNPPSLSPYPPPLVSKSSLLVMDRKSTADDSTSFVMKSPPLFLDRKRTVFDPPRAADD
jgi:hypothetical protein